jgi:hypothetical protein
LHFFETYDILISYICIERELHSCESFSSLSKIQTFIALRHFDINILRAFETKNSQTCEQQQSLGPPKKFCTEVLAIWWLFKQNQHLYQLGRIQSTRCSEVSVSYASLTVITFLFPLRALGTSVQIDVRYETGKIEAEIGEKLSLEDLSEEDKEETGNKTAVSLPPSPSTSNKFSFPETFFPASGFLFPSSLSPPPPFLLPRSSGSFGGREFFFDTPMLPKTELEMNQVQTIRKVLDPFYRLTS